MCRHSSVRGFFTGYINKSKLANNLCKLKTIIFLHILKRLLIFMMQDFLLLIFEKSFVYEKNSFVILMKIIDLHVKQSVEKYMHHT